MCYVKAEVLVVLQLPEVTVLRGILIPEMVLRSRQAERLPDYLPEPLP